MFLRNSWEASTSLHCFYEAFLPSVHGVQLSIVRRDHVDVGHLHHQWMNYAIVMMYNSYFKPMDDGSMAPMDDE
jgi:hypothetical protein